MTRSARWKLALVTSPVWTGILIFAVCLIIGALPFGRPVHTDGLVGLLIAFLLLYALATPLGGAAALWLHGEFSVAEKVGLSLLYIPVALLIAVVIGVFSACSVISCQS